MLRRTLWCLVRQKHGQKAWSPNSTSGGAAPTNGVTAQEALQIAYRPMPPAQTVEYEEDFGPSMIIHREFISAKYRTRMASDISQLAYSDVELSRSRRQLADVMNRERRGVLVGAAGEEADRVLFNSDVDDTTREVKSARFLFNEQRMQFCDRFQTFFRERIERQKNQLDGSTASGQVDAGDDNHFYFSLMEACAVLHGCEAAEAREAYYRRFLGLNLDALEAEDEALRSRLVDAAAVEAQLAPSTSKGSEREQDRDALLAASCSGKRPQDGLGASQSAAVDSKSSTEVVQDIIGALPPLFPSSLAPSTAAETTTRSREEKEEESLRPSPTAPEVALAASASLPSSSESATTNSTAHLSDDIAPLYRAYLAHARGESPVGSYDTTTIGAHAEHAERRRWRSLMDKIAAEEYHNLTPTELEDAYILNQQLHTVKFFDLKVGDTVREIVQLLQRGSSSSADRDTPLETSPTHPERRM
ncbi:hypothetical protein ABB37_04382 [Leptomonas pyrrhocoris]|uniref:Uncharacterized protein n=1 Tax=Leptomonas pyrrhocoris TaxID=157538 RepID=A0A0N0VFE7_LEPPY|nr:hypothetical protein ABB37_04382 [Leptomonas pyrrhocoris]KPA81001.1 hypothetical protein ABB37_04382 [Leptomonas pyrrhocoris]|eukprot:XP_015659440.1 hypothetical protein ABB37_04382 [Leptomonas pyrrhocoris]